MLPPESQQVTADPNTNTVFMVWKFKNDISQQALLEGFQSLCALVINVNHTAANRYSPEKANLVMGISHSAWLTLDLPKPLPKELVEFQPIQGAKHTAVSTPGDLHFHVRATHRSVAYDIAAIITDALRDIAESIVEVHGFRYWDGRAIIGFVDGTENPQTPASREYFGVVGDEDPEYRGGSYQFVQKYIHDMTAWNNLPVSEQEKSSGAPNRTILRCPTTLNPATRIPRCLMLAMISRLFAIICPSVPWVTTKWAPTSTVMPARSQPWRRCSKYVYRRSRRQLR